MKTPLLKTLVAVCCVSAQCLTATAQTQLIVDPSQNWIGYMNIFNRPADGGAYQFGNSWGTSDLRAFFSPGELTILPNTNVWETTDTYWVKADGVTPNKNMDANFYVQNDALAGLNLEFSGLCISNTLVSGPDNYSSVAFIKDFSPSYALVGTSTANLVSGQPFSIDLATIAGDHIQYGFETIGPDANPVTVSTLGFAIVQAPEPSSLALVGLGFLALRRRRSK